MSVLPDDAIYDLFEAALALPTEEREAFLNQACADPAVRAAVARLLAADVAADAVGFLDASLPVNARQLVGADEPEERDGTRVGPYELRGRIGRGGLGEVYRAHDTDLGREVALKRLRGSRAEQAEQAARFQREIEVTARLQHPGVVPVYGRVEDAGRVWYAMRLVEGPTLREAIRDYHASEKPDPLVLRQLLTRFVTVRQTMAYAHDEHIVHRDLKPQNVLPGKYGETLVADWGLAKSLLEVAPEPHPGAAESAAMTETASGQALGTPGYASPEQAAGQWERVNASSDIYSLGATLYCILTGQAPMSGGNWAEVAAKGRDTAFPRPRQLKPGVPRSLEAVCLKALMPEPRHRQRSASELASEIEHWLADDPVQAYREPVLARLGRWGRRHRVLVTSGLLLLILLPLAASTVLWQMARVERAEMGEKVQYAQTLASQGQEQMQNGKWKEALEFLEEALEANHPRPTQIRLGKVRCLHALNDGSAAREELQRARKERDADAEAAHLLLWEAEMESGNDPEMGYKLRSLAIQKGFNSPADRAYAAGMLAETAVAAKEKFQEALGHEPLHLQANQALVFTLMVLGEPEEARDRIKFWNPFFKDIPGCLFIEIWNRAAYGETDEAAKILARLLAVVEKPPVPPELFIDFLAGFSNLELVLEEKDFMGRLIKKHGPLVVLQLPGLLLRIESNVYLQMPHYLHRAWPRLCEFLQRQMLGAVKDPQDVVALGEIVRSVPSPTLEFMLGLALVANARIPEAESVIVRVARSPSPRVKRPALYFAFRCQWQLSLNHPGDQAAHRARAIQTLRQLLATGDPHQNWCETLATAAWISSEFDLGRQICQAWEKHKGDPVKIELMRARMDYYDTHYLRAARRASRVLKHDPNTSDARLILKSSPPLLFKEFLRFVQDVFWAR